jgi:hypothetical protein
MICNISQESYSLYPNPNGHDNFTTGHTKSAVNIKNRGNSVDSVFSAVKKTWILNNTYKGYYANSIVSKKGLATRQIDGTTGVSILSGVYEVEGRSRKCSSTSFHSAQRASTPFIANCWEARNRI